MKVKNSILCALIITAPEFVVADMSFLDLPEARLAISNSPTKVNNVIAPIFHDFPEPTSEIQELFPYHPPVKKQKRKPFKKPKKTNLVEGSYQYRIVVKFIDQHKIRQADKKFSPLKKSMDKTINVEVEKINRFMEKSYLMPERLFDNKTEKQIDLDKEKAERLSHKYLADLNSYYDILVNNFSKEKIEDIINFLNRSPIVEIAYAPPIPINAALNAPPVDIGVATPVLNQGYLDVANQGGVGIQWAWNHPIFNQNIRGNGIRLIDMELGWNLDHEDLAFVTGDLLTPTINAANNDHGTAVLGQLIAADNGYGVTGICNQVDIGMYGILPDATHRQNVADAIQDIIAPTTGLPLLEDGDVLLIEQQTWDWSLTASSCVATPYVPVEQEPAVFNQIEQATAEGIVVVEAAGNGGLDLTAILPNNSGAILVGAGSGDANHNPLCFSNYGTPVDLQGWGENVVTTGYGDANPAVGTGTILNEDEHYTSTFAGTSSASPIVAGVIASLNGHFKATLSSFGNGDTPGTGRILRANAMQILLQNTGTPQGTVNDTSIPITDPLHQIGELPNIQAALQAGLPIANITANGLDTPINVGTNTNVDVKLNLATGGLTNLEADWWVIYQLGSTLYFLNPSMQWTTNEVPVMQTGIFDFADYTLFSGSLPAGSYTYYFGVDTHMNGVLDIQNALFYDSIVINVN